MYTKLFNWACELVSRFISCFFFFNDTATTEIYTLSLHDALPISGWWAPSWWRSRWGCGARPRSEEHTSELQSRRDLVCRLLLEKKKKIVCTLLLQKKKKTTKKKKKNKHNE